MQLLRCLTAGSTCFHLLLRGTVIGFQPAIMLRNPRLVTQRTGKFSIYSISDATAGTPSASKASSSKSLPPPPKAAAVKAANKAQQTLKPKQPWKPSKAIPILPFGANLRTAKDQKAVFSIMSYNVLLPNSGDGWWIYKCYQSNVPMEHRTWPYRQKLLREQILTTRPDVLCVQEASAVNFADDFGFMTQAGYDVCLHNKKARFRPATFWRKDRFALVDESHKHRVLMVGLECLSAESSTSAAAAGDNDAATPGRVLYLCNCHLAGGAVPDIRLRQVVEALDQVKKSINKRKAAAPPTPGGKGPKASQASSAISPADASVVVCGDFNGYGLTGVKCVLEQGAVSPDFRETEYPQAITSRVKKQVFGHFSNVYKEAYGTDSSGSESGSGRGGDSDSDALTAEQQCPPTLIVPQYRPYFMLPDEDNDEDGADEVKGGSKSRDEGSAAVMAGNKEKVEGENEKEAKDGEGEEGGPLPRPTPALRKALLRMFEKFAVAESGGSGGAAVNGGGGGGGDGSESVMRMEMDGLERWLITINGELGRGSEYRTAVQMMEDKGRDYLLFEDLVDLYMEELRLGKIWGVAHDLGVCGIDVNKDILPQAPLTADGGTTVEEKEAVAYQHTYDYIFYSTGSLEALAVMDPMEERRRAEMYETRIFLPNSWAPSDHLPVSAILQWRTKEV